MAIRDRPYQRQAGSVRIVAIILASLLLLVTGAVVTYRWIYTEHVYPGVSDARGLELGGLTLKEASEALGQRYDPYLKRELRLRYDDEEWLVRAETLGARLEIDRVLDAALRVGRQGTLLQQFGEQLAARRSGEVVNEPAFTVDEQVVAAYLAKLAKDIDRPPIDARLVIAPDYNVGITPSQMGRALDSQRATELLIPALTGPSSDGVVLPVVERAPAVVAGDLEPARIAIGRMLSVPLTLKFENRTWTLSRGVIAKLLLRDGNGNITTRTPDKLDEDGLAKFVANLAAEIDQAPRRPRIQLDQKRWRVIREGRPGYTLDEAAAVEAIKAGLTADVRTVVLPVKVTLPAGMSDDHEAIKELISSATTSYAGGLAERRFNVELAASKLNGVVVGPGEVYSFNEELGPVTLLAGFKWGWGISQTGQGEVITVPSVAGGICQVSTTLFQALFWAGYQIEERNWHLYWIDRYGQPPVGLKGLDATVDQVYGKNGKLLYAIDLKFKNTTPYPILIEAKTDGGNLTFNLYSTKLNWQVKVDPPKIENVVKADPTVVKEVDGSLAAGQEVWIEAAQDGFRSTIVRTVTEPGKEPRVLRLISTYKPSRNVVRVGPPRGQAPEPARPSSPAPNPVVPGQKPGEAIPQPIQGGA